MISHFYLFILATENQPESVITFVPNGSDESAETKLEETTDDQEQVVNEQELKYWKAVKENPSDFTSWTYLLQFVEQEVCLY